MTHYHLYMGCLNGPPLREMKFEDYEESIQQFAGLSNQMFGKTAEPDTFSIINAYRATQFGESQIVVVGGLPVFDSVGNLITHAGLCVYWMKCDIQCRTSSLN